MSQTPPDVAGIRFDDSRTWPPRIRQRYGLDRSPWPRRLLVAAVVAAFVAMSAYVGVALSSRSTESRLLTWSQQAADRVDITFEVRKAPGQAVRCLLRAQDSDRVDVGYALVEVEPGKDYQQLTYSLRVLGPAAIAEVLDCRTPGEQLRAPGPQFPPGVVPPDQPWSPAQG